ncbi:CRISPR-associated protein Cmr2 [Ferrithrix thermotolerans DSM 19514]|uniref:CRISPR-associated protein Cmr2 n=1 Tax=Ferrithrix thermotolerans DSM 19514 TaxID=1121881 RepID=A0A1M4XNG9_9ACTN|nr:type III-B CRISPR-associated protein Cas10/Cmr2 [Ferrithrix thermotolerans]SHE95029.1 CRISPR-associated protein Cmr2 [Ferrithrix thermotolerans DSM 19514]
MSSTELWKKKLAAWIHDPVEKAIVLGRTSYGHENGSLAYLREQLHLEKGDYLSIADHWASAGDRPQWPSSSQGPQLYVNFTKDPVIKHPISKESFDLGAMSIPVGEIETFSSSHFKELIVKNEQGEIDYESTFLAFWRFGPSIDNYELGSLWRVLPADTRVPDHTIWNHLDLVSAFATALDGDPALLEFSIGPVQSFIKQARSTADLWAGSHLLSVLTFEAMIPIIESYGPDSVLFPSLRGQPQLDLWLLERVRGKDDQIGGFKWWDDHLKRVDFRYEVVESDSYPAFTASLPNKFVALVPYKDANEVALRAKKRLFDAVHNFGKEATSYLFADRFDDHMKDQIDRQLREFPETYWSTIRWPKRDKPIEEAARELDGLLRKLAGDGESSTHSLFKGTAWESLLGLEGKEDIPFRYKANPGVLFPGVLRATEIVHAAAKQEKLFLASEEKEFRCTTCGEREWLCTSNEAREYESSWPTPSRRKNSIWSELSKSRPSLAKEGEHLCALCSLKRGWPGIFSKRLEDLTGREFSRYIVSTHVMADVPKLVAARFSPYDPETHQAETYQNEQDRLPYLPAMPPKLYRELSSRSKRREEVERHYRDPIVREEDDTEEDPRDSMYYALLKMDGDRMGKLLQEGHQGVTVFCSWHPKVKRSVTELKSSMEAGDNLDSYLQSQPLPSPALQKNISESLANFSLVMVRQVLESMLYGKIIYAGGDDLLAFLPRTQVVDALGLLRQGFSGEKEVGGVDYFQRAYRDGYRVGSGFFYDKGSSGSSLRTLLGAGVATASFGVVIAHAKTPLSQVLVKTERAEALAKRHGRNGFCLYVAKRSGGDVAVFGSFERASKGYLSPLECINSLTSLLGKEVSRRAAYLASSWLRSIPDVGEADLDETSWFELVTSMLKYQFARQSKVGNLGEKPEMVAKVVDSLVKNVLCDRLIQVEPKDSEMSSKSGAIVSTLLVAEFLARSVDGGGN